MSRVYVAPISFGLGDLVVSLPAIQALIAQGQHDGTETWLVAHARCPDAAGRSHRWIDRLGDGAVVRPGRSRRSLRRPPGSSTATRLVVGIAGVRATPSELSRSTTSSSRICADLGIDADFTRPIPLTASPRPEYRSSVLLVTESDGAVEAMVRRLVEVPCRTQFARTGTRRANRHSRRGGSRDARARDRGRARRHRPATRSTCSASAAAVIGIDTGLTHLAVQQGTPTVTICRAPAVFFRPWPHARVVVGDRCDDACIAARDGARLQRRWSTCAGCAGSRGRAPSEDAASMPYTPRMSSAHWSNVL